MANSYFRFKQFTVHQDRCAMKVTTDACLFGAWAAREVLSQGHVARNMFDIGTGTGLLLLMVAQKNPAITIDAVEIDKDAYTQATENIRAAGFKNKIYLQHADITQNTGERKFDIIICNPPFYENELRSPDNQKNIAHHDESLSLEKLLPIIKSRLLSTSRFYLLLPYKRKTEIESLFKRNDLHFTHKVSVRQSVSHDYFRLMIAGSLYRDFESRESEIVIRNEQDQYTPGFIQLLKDYYLYL